MWTEFVHIRATLNGQDNIHLTKRNLGTQGPYTCPYHPYGRYASAYKSITNRNVFVYTYNKRSACIGKLARNLSLGAPPRRIKPEDHHAYWQLSNRRSVSVHFSLVNLRPYYE
jgi:hypothetical protein